MRPRDGRGTATGYFAGVHAGRDDATRAGCGALARFSRQEVVPRDDEIARRDSGAETRERFGVVEPAWRVRVAEPHRVVEVEDEPPDAAAEQRDGPAREELPLNDHGVGVDEVAAEGRAGRTRELGQRVNFQRVPGGRERVAERRQPIAAADVILGFGQRDQPAPRPSVA